MLNVDKHKSLDSGLATFYPHIIADKDNTIICNVQHKKLFIRTYTSNNYRKKLYQTANQFYNRR